MNARISLPQPETGQGPGLWGVLNQRRSRRRYVDRALSLAQLSQLLWATYGISGARGDRRLRTAPSAGALFPLDVYVLVNRVADVPAGYYQYQPEDHVLVPAGHEVDPQALRDACLGQSMITEAGAVFCLVAVPDRAVPRYGERAHRYIGLDAGHAMQNLYLAAEALGLGCCAIGAFRDEAVNRVLGLDGVRRWALYLGTVGSL